MNHNNSRLKLRLDGEPQATLEETRGPFYGALHNITNLKIKFLKKHTDADDTEEAIELPDLLCVLKEKDRFNRPLNPDIINSSDFKRQKSKIWTMLHKDYVECPVKGNPDNKSPAYQILMSTEYIIYDDNEIVGNDGPAVWRAMETHAQGGTDDSDTDAFMQLLMGFQRDPQETAEEVYERLRGFERRQTNVGVTLPVCIFANILRRSFPNHTEKIDNYIDKHNVTREDYEQGCTDALRKKCHTCGHIATTERSTATLDGLIAEVKKAEGRTAARSSSSTQVQYEQRILAGGQLRSSTETLRAMATPYGAAPSTVLCRYCGGSPCHCCEICKVVPEKYRHARWNPAGHTTERCFRNPANNRDQNRQRGSWRREQPRERERAAALTETEKYEVSSEEFETVKKIRQLKEKQNQ